MLRRSVYILARPTIQHPYVPALTYCTRREDQWAKATDSSRPLTERARAAFESGKAMLNDFTNNPNVQQAKEAVSSAAESVKETYQEAKHKVEDMSSDDVKNTANQAKEKAKSAAKDAKETVKEGYNKAKDVIEDVKEDDKVQREAKKAKNADTVSEGAEHAKKAVKNAANKASEKTRK